MNIVEMYDLCKKIYEENLDKYEYIGLRYENKERLIGEICENSRNNTNREDERDFPKFNTEEYFEMEELDGTSAWDMSEEDTYKINKYENRENDCSKHFMANHCYIIASNNLGHTSNTIIDVNEIVIRNAIVIEKIF